MRCAAVDCRFDHLRVVRGLELADRSYNQDTICLGSVERLS